MESTLAIGTDSDHKITALGNRIDQIRDYPRRAFVVLRHGLVREGRSERVNDEPWRVRIGFLPWDKSLGSVVIAVIADTAGAQHYVRLESAQMENRLAQHGPYLR